MNRITVSSAQHGFTLVELMIAMTLVSMLMAMIYASFSLAVKGWDGIDGVSADNEEMRVLQTFLFGKLSQIRPLVNQDKGAANLVFQGEKESLQFVATAPAHREAVDGLYIYQLGLNSDSQDQLLELRYGRYPEVSALAGNENRPVKLLDSIANIEFSYYGRLGKGEAQWHSKWSDQYRLPKLVRIVVARNNFMPQWPAFVIPLKSGTKL